MSINLIKKELQLTEVVCQKCSQTMVEGDMIVPDVKPDIKKVLDVSGNASISQSYIQQDKVIVQGVVHMNFLYVPDGDVVGKLKSLSLSKEFSHSLECRGITPDMQLSVEVEPENFDHTLVNSRKINLRCLIKIQAKVVKNSTIDVATGIESCPHIALKKERFRLSSSTPTAQCKIILKEQLELPSGKPTIGEILKINAIPSSVELCMMENKAVAKGQVKLCLLYNSDDTDSIEFMEYGIPFTEIIDAVGVMEGMDGEIDYSLSDIYYEVRDNSDGEPRNLGFELVLDANLKGTEVNEIEIITDGYSTTGGLDLAVKPCKIEQLLDINTAEITVTDAASLPSMAPDIKQVYDVTSSSVIDRISVTDGEINVQGRVDTKVLYLSTDPSIPVSSFKHSTDFSHIFYVPDIKTNTVCDARAIVDHTSYTLSGNNSLDLKFIIGITVKSLNTGTINIIEDMVETIPENQDKTPCIIIYFVKSGDTLWDIAKRYGTTVEEIKKINGLDKDTIYPGQQIKLVVM